MGKDYVHNYGHVAPSIRPASSRSISLERTTSDWWNLEQLKEEMAMSAKFCWLRYVEEVKRDIHFRKGW